MYPRLSSLPGESGGTDIYVFCAPRAWRKNLRTLFHALGRGRNYNEDGNVRNAQQVGMRIAETLMICDLDALASELRGVRDAISALNLSVNVSPRCCPHPNGEPGLPPPSPAPPPPDEPPAGDLPPSLVYCRAARALARNLRAILRDLAGLALFNALTPREIARVLTQLGLDQQTVTFISVTVGLVSLVYRLLDELLNNVAGSLLQILHDALLEAANAIDEELFTCCFVPFSANSAIVDCCKQKVDELELNVLLRAFIKLLIYEEKLVHLISGRVRNAAGELIDIDWLAAGVSAAPCCEGDPVWTVEASGNQAPACGAAASVTWYANTAGLVDVEALVSKDGTYGAYGFRVARYGISAQSVTVTLIESNQPARFECWTATGRLGVIPLVVGQPATMTPPSGSAIVTVLIQLQDVIYTAPCPQPFRLLAAIQYG